MAEGLAIPYCECLQLKKVTLELRKWDASQDDWVEEVESILDTIVHEIPSIEEYPKFETFEIGVTGKDMYEG